MKLYIDLENLNSLAKMVCSNDVLKRFIRENFDIYYTFDKSIINKRKDYLITWEANLSKGRNGRVTLDRILLPISETYSTTENTEDFLQEELQSVFIVNNKAIPYGLLSCKVGGGLNLLKNLLIEEKYIPAKFYYTRPEEDEKILEWEIVSRNVSPCTDIIINDSFLFAQSEIEYESNSYKLIEELCKKSVNQVVNIVIVTKLNFKMREKKGSECKDVPHTINTTAIRKRIKSISKDVTNQEAKVTIIALDDEDYKKNRIHDRTIFTNYKLYISGDSFTYYLEKGGSITSFTSHGIWLGVCSLYDEEHNMIAQRFLKDVQDVITSAKNQLIFGERESNFLSIPQKKH